MAAIRYIMRAKTNKKTSINALFVRLQHNTLYLQTHSGLYIDGDSWHRKNQRVKPAKVTKENKHLDRQLSELERYLLSCWQNDLKKEKINKDWLTRKVEQFHNKLADNNKDEILFLEYIEDFIKEAPNAVIQKSGKKLSPKTIQRYKTAQVKIKNFVNKYYKYIELKDVDIKFYNNYYKYLTNELKLAVNTVGKEIAVLKTFLHAAKPMGIKIDTSDFTKPSETSDSIYLNEKELSLIYNYNFSENKRLEKIRDLFIVGCWTGLRFSDLTTIKPENIKDDMIYLTQFKTDFDVIIPVHEMTRNILEKYNYNLPTDISNPKFNEYIKEVCVEVELNEKITKRITRAGKKESKTHEKHELVTVHTARRSFATNLYLDDFPTISIMAITGHQTESSFLKYIKVTPQQHAKKLLEHWRKRKNN